MPIYEYACDGCGSRFEVIAASRSMKPESPKCPSCGKKRTKGVVSSCAIGRAAAKAVGPACDISAGGG